MELVGLLPEREGRWRRFWYAVLSIPLGAAYLGLFALLVTAVVTAVQLIGFALFLVVLALARGFGGLERRLAARLLDVHLDETTVLRRQRGGLVRRLRALLMSGSTWRSLAWLGVRVLFATAVLATGFFAVVLGWAVVIYPELTALPRVPLLDIVALVLLVLVVVGVFRLLDLEVRLLGAVAPALLGVSSQERIDALRTTSLRLAQRNSVARDLHDTIGHTLTASLLQATAARRTLTPDPDEPDREVDPTFARQALAHIEDNTRSALAELDRALAVLGDRRGDRRGTPDAGSDLPAPDLHDVDALVAGLRDGGLPLTIALNVVPDDVPEPVSRLAYRVIQEGTTNVMRHAGTPPTVVEVDRRGDRLLVRVHNALTGRSEPRPGPGGGHGISGLRDRVVALGGELSAGRASGGGFELSASLPLAAR